MTDGIGALAARHDRFFRWGKGLSLAALVTFLAALASGYETTAGTLLDGRASYLALVLDVPIRDYRYIWGGPATLQGLQMAVSSLSILGIARLIWMRLARGHWSRLGLALWLCPPIIGLSALSDITPMVYPVTLGDAPTERLFAAIEQRQPGLIARLGRGDRGDRLGSVEAVALGKVSIGEDGVHRSSGVPVEDLLLDERRTIEGLRFALAERAVARGDKAGLLRLLPLELAKKPIDMPARYAFARRMERMERLAGRPVVAAADRPELARRIMAWHAVLDVFAFVRPAMQIAFLAGLIASLVAWYLGRRLKRLDQARITLSAAAPDGPLPTLQHQNFDRRAHLPTVP